MDATTHFGFVDTTFGIQDDHDNTPGPRSMQYFLTCPRPACKTGQGMRRCQSAVSDSALHWRTVTGTARRRAGAYPHLRGPGVRGRLAGRHQGGVRAASGRHQGGVRAVGFAARVACSVIRQPPGIPEMSGVPRFMT